MEGDGCPGYVMVSWFSEQEYLFGRRSPLGVRVVVDKRQLERDYGSIVRLTQVDPSQVIIEPDSENNCYMMMRDSGYDTRVNI